ncbi:MAG: hypothetical protein IH988_06690 [Planctomycetes bacterium]|nr:hypothetical protein [Planctomycetota bacterium]
MKDGPAEAGNPCVGDIDRAVYQLTERFTANKSRLLGLLAELGECRRTAYLTPATLGALRQATSAARDESSVAGIARQVGDSDTGPPPARRRASSS